jgi:tetratricopeptide (TPR) repeat protein
MTNPRKGAAVLLCCLALAGGSAFFVWRRINTPAPPVVHLVDPDPFVIDAIESARNAVLHSPRSASAWGQLGMTLQAYDLHRDARICLARAEKLDPHDGRWAYLLALSMLTEDLAAGLEQLEHATDLCASTPAPRLKLGEVLLEQGRLDEAEKQFQAVLAYDPENPRAELGLGRVASARGNWPLSLEHLSRSVQKAPQVRATHAMLAEVHARLGDTQAAEEERRRLAHTGPDPGWPDPYLETVKRLKTSVQTRLYEATGLLQQDRVEEALAIVQEVVRRRPDHFVARLAHGRALLFAGNLAAAEEEFREAVRLKPDSVATQSELASILRRRNKFREAADTYRIAVQLKPQDASSYYNLGLCLENLGDRPGAVAALRKAVQYKPDLAQAHRDLGRLLAQDGDLAAAERHLRDAVHLAPEDDAAKQLLTQVRQQAGKGKR